MCIKINKKYTYKKYVFKIIKKISINIVYKKYLTKLRHNKK